MCIFSKIVCTCCATGFFAYTQLRITNFAFFRLRIIANGLVDIFFARSVAADVFAGRSGMIRLAPWMRQINRSSDFHSRLQEIREILTLEKWDTNRKKPVKSVHGFCVPLAVKSLILLRNGDPGRART
jgi:hypothetical protein